MNAVGFGRVVKANWKSFREIAVILSLTMISLGSVDWKWVFANSCAVNTYDSAPLLLWKSLYSSTNAFISASTSGGRSKVVPSSLIVAPIPLWVSL